MEFVAFCYILTKTQKTLILLHILCFQWFREKGQSEFNFRRLHHIEFRSDSDAARCAATVVSANKPKGF